MIRLTANFAGSHGWPFTKCLFCFCVEEGYHCRTKIKYGKKKKNLSEILNTSLSLNDTLIIIRWFSTKFSCFVRLGDFLWFSRPNQRFLVWFRTEEFRHDSSPELFLDACYTNICIGREMKPLHKDENEKTAISY